MDSVSPSGSQATTRLASNVPQPAHPTASPTALGRPLSIEVAQAAAEWFALLHSGEATDAEHKRWQQWLSADADHERAWTHLQNIMGTLPGLNTGGVAYRSLSPLPATTRQRAHPLNATRRRLLGVFMGVGTAAGAAWFARGTPQWQQMAADYRTGTRRERWTLPDGTDMLLAPGSSATLQFDATGRRVRLLEGQALFATGHPGGAMSALPFLVETRHGSVQALGTKFTVRSNDAGTYTAVLKGAVELRPIDGDGAALRLNAGQATQFTRSGWEVPRAASPADDAWSRGQLWVDDQRLDEFLAELSRYRSGWLRADPAVAGLRVSGVFPLGDGGNESIDAVLAMLPTALPVQLRWRNRWWLQVEPKQDSH